MATRQGREKFLSPELFLSELLRKSAQGKFYERDESTSPFMRATVVAVDTVGGRLENEKGNGSVEHLVDGKRVSVIASVGPDNPRNSVKARILTEGFDQFVGDERLRVFWPLFPEHVSVPVKPGEHIYVMFEDAEQEHGLWFSKVPGQENVNFYRGQDSFSISGGVELSSLFDGGPSSRRNETDRDASESQVTGKSLDKLFG